MNPWLLLLAFAMICRAEVIDRIAVIVGPSVITESEILREIRLTGFLNGDPLDFSAASKRKTAERMVEQRLIQIENEASLYPPPSAESVEQALKEVEKRLANPARYTEELQRTGIKEADLKAHLQRQLTTLRFLDLRFRPGVQITDAEISAYFEQRLAPDLRKSHPGEELSPNDYREQIEQALVAERVDKASDAWLKESRVHTHIEFRSNVFTTEPAPQEAVK